MREKDKNIALEGIRGAAAVAVVLCHCMLGFFPAQSGSFPNFDPNSALTGQPWFGLLNGSAAVTLFFVLSGYVLTRRYFLTGDHDAIVRGAVKRWPRLAGPVAVTVLLSWVLFRSGAYAYVEAGEITGSPWLKQFANALPLETAALGPQPSDFWSALAQGTVRTFLYGDATYNSNLWTMRYEFFGSFISFSLALLLGPQGRLAWAMKIALLIVAGILFRTAGASYLAFFAGVTLAILLPAQTRAMPRLLAFGGLLLAIYLLGLTGQPHGAYSIFAFSARVGSGNLVGGMHIAASMLLIGIVETCPQVRTSFSGRLSAWLGFISFPLYLVHILVLCSAGAATLVLAHPVMGTSARTLAALVTLVGSFLAAWPLAVFNNRWVVYVNRATHMLSIGGRSK